MRQTVNSDPQPLLDQILQSCRSKAMWGNDERGKLKTLREKLGSPTDVAHALDISVATLYSWEKQEASKDKELRPPPSYKHLVKLSDLNTRQHLDSIKPLFSDALMRMRDADDMMRRARLCDEFWVMRSGRPFVAGNDPKTFEVMIKFIQTGANPTQYYFVYVEPSSGREQGGRIFRAMDSFEALQRKLHSCPDEVRAQFHGAPVPQDKANELGLVDPWISFAMAKYSAAGRETYQKRFDVWMEFMFDVSKDAQVEQKQFVWLELPSDEAEAWREKRLKILEDAVDAGRKQDKSRRRK